MFERLSDRLDGVLGQLRQRGVITEKMLKDGLREVRRALLEADVNYAVARDFLKRVETRAIGEDVLKAVRPGDQIVKIVHDELVELLGKEGTELGEAAVPPTVVMLVGLQGSGKTTTAAKLARRLKVGGGSPAMVACDPYRPAAADQLKTLGEAIGVPVVHEPDEEDMARLAKAAVDGARRQGASHVLIDMAGRLQVDQTLMDELKRVREAVAPTEVLLVADGMTGQEAVRIAEGFHETVGLTGVILTKMDGDARGGAALSIFGVLGIPIKFVGTGERPEDLTAFEAQRMAGRILQMGDIVLQKMGPLKGLLKMVPGIKAGMLDDVEVDQKRVKHLEAIIQSMTPDERRKPRILNGSRRARIARGSGRPVHEVNRLLKQFEEMRKMMKQMGRLAPAMKGMDPGDLGRLMR
jgi:signal recognition particle subunit SRP54